MANYYKVTLGHAVSDENGKSSGGKPGDQKQNTENTKGELLFQDWYISGGNKWDAVIRCNDEYKHALIAEDVIKAVRNPMIGYNQAARYTLYDNVSDKGFDCSDTTKNVDCDCSALVTVAANYAGIPIPRDTYTSNMIDRYKATKLFKIYTADSYTKSADKLKVGDILDRSGHHTATVVNTYYHMTRQLRYVEGSLMKGDDVKALQQRLNELGIPDTELVVDGELGKKSDAAIKKYQKACKLEADGIVGRKTAEALGFLYD